MIKRLALVLRPESIPVWLQRPILALDDEKPIELIARGEYRSVAKLIAEIEHMDQTRTTRSRSARTSRHPIGWALAARQHRPRPLPRRHRDNSHSRVVSLPRRVGTLSPQDHIPHDHHRYFPTLEKKINLELVETKTFVSRVVYLRYRRVPSHL